jgi:hypothetical protein
VKQYVQTRAAPPPSAPGITAHHRTLGDGRFHRCDGSSCQCCGAERTNAVRLGLFRPISWRSPPRFRSMESSPTNSGGSDCSRRRALSMTIVGVCFRNCLHGFRLFSPIWGQAADKVGTKPLLPRASLGMYAAIFLMAHTPNTYVLVLLLPLEGVFTGYSTACTTLIATYTSRENAGFAMEDPVNGICQDRCRIVL